jgi:hypothetical protein
MVTAPKSPTGRKSLFGRSFAPTLRDREGKAEAASEEMGKCTTQANRGPDPGILGKIRGDNVGKVPLAAGAGSNLQRLALRCYKHEGCESRWDWHMSPSERRREGNASRSSARRCYGEGNTRAVQRGSGHLAVSVFAPCSDLARQNNGNELTRKPVRTGACTRQRLSFVWVGKAPEERPRSEPDLGKPAVRDRRGARGNVAYGGDGNPLRKRKRVDGNPLPKGARAPALSR